MTRSRPDLDVSPYTLAFPEAPLEWVSVFGNTRRVELEVGPGKGLFLVNAAQRRPEHNFVGVELAHKYARLAAERVARHHLANVRVIAGDGARLLAQAVPPGSLAAVHVYFPDPWWKKRHKKRRVFSESFVGCVWRALVAGGAFHVATDVAEYFEVMTALVAQSERFDEQPAPEVRQPEHELDYLTNFERKYRLAGRPIHRTWYLSRSASVLDRRGDGMEPTPGGA